MEVVHVDGALQLFDEMPVHGVQFKATPNCILKAVIRCVQYLMTRAVLHQVFDNYGIEYDWCGGN